MRISAHVAKANNTTIASSIDSLRWCGESMRAGREIVIIQFRPMSGPSRFLRPAKTFGNKRLSTSLLTKLGQPTCNPSSSSFGTSHGAGSSPQSIRGSTANDRDFSRYPRPRQRGHLCRPCAGCLPRRLGFGDRIDQTSPEGPLALPQWRSSEAGALPPLSVQLKSMGSGSVTPERAFRRSPSW